MGRLHGQSLYTWPFRDCVYLGPRYSRHRHSAGEITQGSTGRNMDLRVQHRQARRGSAVDRPPAQGALTYTADGRFHFITVRTTVPKYASNDPSRPSPEEAMAV